MRHIPTLIILCLLVLTPSEGKSAYSEVSMAIDQFVSQLYPKGSHYFWVINDTTSEFSNEIIVDIHTELQVNSEEDAQPNRFLLLLVKGKLIGAQQIPVGAKVDCHSEEKEI